MLQRGVFERCQLGELLPRDTIPLNRQHNTLVLAGRWVAMARVYLDLVDDGPGYPKEKKRRNGKRMKGPERVEIGVAMSERCVLRS
jgi:hypothetical protein